MSGEAHLVLAVLLTDEADEGVVGQVDLLVDVVHGEVGEVAVAVRAAEESSRRHEAGDGLVLKPAQVQARGGR